MLKENDLVVMHTCGEAEYYKGKIWRCITDEYAIGKDIYKQDIIHLEGYSGSFLTKYLQRVDVKNYIMGCLK